MVSSAELPRMENENPSLSANCDSRPPNGTDNTIETATISPKPSTATGSVHNLSLANPASLRLKSRRRVALRKVNTNTTAKAGGTSRPKNIKTMARALSFVSAAATQNSHVKPNTNR